VLVGAVLMILWFYIRRRRSHRGSAELIEEVSQRDIKHPSTKRSSWRTQVRMSRYWSADDIGMHSQSRVSRAREDDEWDRQSNVVMLPAPDVAHISPGRTPGKGQEMFADEKHSVRSKTWRRERQASTDEKHAPKSKTSRSASKRVRTLSTHISMQVLSMSTQMPSAQKSPRARSSYDRSVVVNLDWQEYR
jgi:hypothetical protein